MQLSERHVINQNHKHFKEIDNLCFLSKNLYNAANYIIRQEFIKNHKYLNYNVIQKQLQNQVDYKALPAKVSQQILMILDKNWKGFFEATKSYNKHPGKFSGRPKLPNYKDKLKGRNIIVYTSQAVSKSSLVKKGVIKPSKTNIELKSEIIYTDLAQVRIVPKLNHYVVEVVYNYPITDIGLDKNNVAGIDLGLSNLATLTSNVSNYVPKIINGNPLKSINQFFNKTNAKLKSILGSKTSKRLQRLNTKRNFKIDNYLHKVSKLIINNLVENNIGTLVIGNNDNWKQNINIGKRNNQNFVQIPFEKLIHQLTYKGKLVGIDVIVTEESYTSKASFLDLDTVPTYKKGIKHTFSGKRIQRGMYKSNSGRLINADCNGSYNIIRKAIPNAFAKGIEGVVVHPVRLNLQMS